jgi:hypothetical protein
MLRRDEDAIQDDGQEREEQSNDDFDIAMGLHGHGANPDNGRIGQKPERASVCPHAVLC